MKIKTIKLTEEQYETLLFLCNGETMFHLNDIEYDYVKGRDYITKFIGGKLYVDSNTDVIHFVK